MLDTDNKRDCFKVIDIFMILFYFLGRGHVSGNWLINDYMKAQKKK